MAETRNLIIGMLIFCLVIGAGIFLIGSFGANNDETNQFNATFNVIGNMSQDISSIRNSTAYAETDFGVFGVLNSLINSAWTGIKILFHTGDVVNAVGYDAEKMFGFPPIIPLVLGLIVIIIISFAIWGAIFQKDL